MKDRERLKLGLERCRTIVVAYGTDPSKRPKGEEEIASRFMEGSAKAAEILNQAADFDPIDCRTKCRPSREPRHKRDTENEENE